MNWLKSMSNNDVVDTYHARLFIIDEQYVASEYAELISAIASSSTMSLVSEDSNWDQAGILTKLIIYKVQETRK